MENRVDKACGKSSRVAMWGASRQACNQASIMNARTVMNSAPIEITAGSLLPKVMDADADKTTGTDKGILEQLEQSGLWEQIRTAVRANPKLDLGADADLTELIEKAQTLKGLYDGTKPKIAQELAMVVKSACSQAGDNVRRQFDLAVAKAPSKVEGSIDDMTAAIGRMDQSTKRNSNALARFFKRVKQGQTLQRLKRHLKETAHESLKSHLIQNAQQEYTEALEEYGMARFEDYWKAECESVRERCEKFVKDSNTYRVKVRACEKECSARLDRTKEHLTTLRMTNEVVLQEASEDEFLANLMAGRKVGSRTELIDGLRHDLEQRLRKLAERKGMGQRNAQDMAFRALVLALSTNDIVDAFVALLTESTSGSCSFYRACQAYGLKRLVSELSRRSRITSWFDGRDDARFGITRFELKMVRLPMATTQEEAQIKEILERLFQAEEFHDILHNGRTRSISVMRLYAGWPIAIEGGNPVLLEAYKKSAQTGHLPHLIGILPDTRAGEHAAGIMKL